MSEETKNIELSAKLQKIATEIEGLTVLEISELVSYLEEKFGVSAMPMMAAAPAGGAAADAAPAEEKTSFNVVLTDAGANKLGVIKAVRELRQDLGLMDAKKLVETPPQTLLENVKKEEADAAVAKLTEAGAKAELK
jgi:large subunit ribosomal protein L7/L12